MFLLTITVLTMTLQYCLYNRCNHLTIIAIGITINNTMNITNNRQYLLVIGNHPLMFMPILIMHGSSYYNHIQQYKKI